MKYSFNTLLISSLCLISASRGVSAQTTQPSQPNQAVSPYSNPMGALINSPTITDSTADWKSKAQSTVDSLPTAVGPSLLPSKEMTNTATFNLSVTQEKQKAALAVQEASTEGNLLDKVKARLPREVNSVKFGAHITVSPQGAEVIDNIRALATAKGEIQNTLLSAIANAAKSGVPEAENFVGLIYEIGLFATKRNIQQATALYQAAASKNYPPAIFNLALVEYYGKGINEAAANANARVLLTRTAHLVKGQDNFRVCGMASLVNYQFGKMALANEFAAECESPLSNLAKVNSSTMTTDEKIRSLRFFAETGANDAFPLLEQVTKADLAKNENYPYCTWHIFNAYMGKISSSAKEIRVDAGRCVAAYFKGETKTPTNSMKVSLGVTSVIAGVNAELVNLKKLRQSSRIHYSWPVPYLPFNIVESDIFYPLMSASLISSVAAWQQKESLN